MRVFDIFLYNGEKELLEIRLNILKETVSHFVIIESPLTFTGLEKPIYYKPEDFPEFKDKIIHLICPKAHHPGIWHNEWFSRNFAWQIYPMLHGEDVIIFSDVDEVPNPDTLKEVIGNVDEPVTLNQTYNFYKFNLRCINEATKNWPGSVVTKACHIRYGSVDVSHWFTKDFGFQKLREGRATYPRIENGGWHFSYCLETEEIQRKIKSFCHANELDKPERNNPEHISNCISKGESIWVESDGNKMEKFEMDESNTPKYILDNLDKYKHLILSNTPD